MEGAQEDLQDYELNESYQCFYITSAHKFVMKPVEPNNLYPIVSCSLFGFFLFLLVVMWWRVCFLANKCVKYPLCYEHEGLRVFNLPWCNS